MSSSNRKKASKSKLLISINTAVSMVFVGCVVLALYVKVAFKAYHIPSPEMQPTLKIDDRVFVEKFAYSDRQPQRSDIIAFNPNPTLRKNGFENALIKRIIGLPGEKVTVQQGKVYINDRPLSESYIAESPKYQSGPIIIPANSYFVLGDNRNQSYDSRDWGFVPSEDIIGKVSHIYWPFNRINSIK